MNNAIATRPQVPAMADGAIENVRMLQSQLLELPQAEIGTHHVIHGGMYARTITIPAGVMLVGALIKVPTTLIVNGNVSVYLGDSEVQIKGYRVLAASANRKQAFAAHEDTQLTMIFSTDATTIESAEDEFTNESGALMSRHPDAINEITITGE